MGKSLLRIDMAIHIYLMSYGFPKYHMACMNACIKIIKVGTHKDSVHKSYVPDSILELS